MTTTTIQRQEMFVCIATVILGMAIALPFTLIHAVLPFTVLLVVFGIFMVLRKQLRLPKYPTAYLMGCLVALVLLLPTVSAAKLMEQGFNDGPFYGENYTNGFMGLEVHHRTDYRKGELLIYNRQKNSAPVLTYQVDGEILWARTMDVRQHPKYQNYFLTDIENPTVTSGFLRDRLNFLGTWEFGKEPGRAYLWKWGGFHRFYLSW
ncbi:MAG: hypothetical protein AAGE59_23845 [Cyanobacteria bacterium P01_F01_bin.86]